MNEIELESYLTVPFKLLQISGLWQVKGSSKFYKIYGIIFHVFGLDLYTTCQLIFILSADSLLDLSDSLSVFFTYFILCIKSIRYMMNLDAVLLLIKDFNETILLMQKIEKKTMAKVTTRLRHAKLFFFVFWGSCMSACIVGAFVPITTFIINPNPPYHNPYKTWFPYDFKNEFGWFLFVATYQSSNAIFYTGVAAALDTFPVLCFNACAGLLEELSDRMTCIGACIEEKEVKLEANLRKLEKYIAVHLKIKALIKKAENFFSPLIFAQGAVSLIILCTSAYSLSKVRSESHN